MTEELTVPSALGRALREARRFDRSRVSVRAGLIASLPVVAVLALGTVIGRPVAAVTMGAGAMLGGVAWRAAGPDDPPVGTMIASVAGLGLATLAGSASGRHPWLHLLLLIVLCLAAGLLVALGRRGTVPGTQAIIAYIVFGRFSQPLDAALGLAGLVVAGGAVQAAFAAVVGRPPAWRGQRQALAEAYGQLAVLAARPGAASAAAALALDAAELKLTAPALRGDPAAMTLSSLVEEGRRIRLELIVIGAGGGAGAAQAARILSLVGELVADPDRDRDAALEAALRELDGRLGPEPDRHVVALAGQLHATARLAEVARHGRPWAAARPSRGSGRATVRLRSDLQQLRANASLHTAAGRHAVRLAAVVAVAELIVERAGLPRGYWAVVAAATVLRPEFGATFTRGAERMAGAVIGVVLASLIAAVLNPGGWGIVVVVGLLAWATYAMFPASFAVGIAWLTGVIVFLIHGVAPDTATLALDRGLDSVLGGALGLAAYALWPTWSGGSAGRVMADLVDAQRAYVVAVLGLVISGAEPVDAELRPLARRARVAWSNADAVITLAQSEPARRLGETGMRATAALGGLRRLVYAGHTARLEITAEREREAQPAWTPFVQGLDRALMLVATRLRGEPGAVRLPPLRALLRAAQASAPLEPALLGPLDELVDATDTVGASLGLSPPA